MNGSDARSWQVLLLDPSGKVLGGRRLEATAWLEAVRDFAGHAGKPLGRGGLVCSIQADGSFLVYESQVARVFLARPAAFMTDAAELPERRSSTLPGLGAFGDPPVSAPSAPEAPVGPPEAQAGSVEVERARPTSSTKDLPPEPAVVVDPALVREVSRLEQMARWDEVSEDASQSLLPHRVLWCKQTTEPAGGPVVRCALAVWPDAPRHALEKLVKVHADGLKEQLARRGAAVKVTVAAFDHAFHKVPVRPPVAVAVFGGAGEAEPAILTGEEAERVWPVKKGKTQGLGFRTSGDSGTVMVPAVQLEGGVVTPVLARPSGASDAAAGPGTAGQEGRVDASAVPGPAAATEPSARTGPRTESLLFLAFDALHRIYGCQTRGQAAGLVLETMVNLVPVEVGAVYLYDDSVRALRLQTARGAAGSAAPRIHVSMGQGLAGACAQQGVALALTEVGRDARFGSVLASRLGIAPASLLGAPVEHQGRLFGAVELINRKGREGFSGGEVEVIAYAARMLAERLSVLPESETDSDSELEP